MASGPVNGGRQLTVAKSQEAALAKRLLFAQQAIAEHVAQLLPVGDLFCRVLETMCETLEWSFGAVWQIAPDDTVLRCSGAWRRTEPIVEFEAVTRRHAFAPGEGVPGASG